MVSSVRSGMGGRVVAVALTLSPAAMAADVGGFYADQQKAGAAAASNAASEACIQAVSRAATEATAVAGYRAALCYLQAPTPDTVAAKGWLARSSEMGFVPAQRLLRSLSIVETGAHQPGPHCHALGEGQQICHGGTAQTPLATAATQ